MKTMVHLLFFVFVLFGKSQIPFTSLHGAMKLQEDSFGQSERKYIPDNLLQLYANHPECEFLKKMIAHYDVFLDVYQRCHYQFLPGCGSYLFDGKSYAYCELMYEKQKLLYEAAKRSTRALEVGVYMGHSIFIMLLANPDLQVTCVDIDDRFSRPAIELLKSRFNSCIDFIKGDSLSVLPGIDKQFDLFHIDGHHARDYIVAEFKLCAEKRSQSRVLFVIDDYDVCSDAIASLVASNEQMQLINCTIPECSWRNMVAEVLFHE